MNSPNYHFKHSITFLLLLFILQITNYLHASSKRHVIETSKIKMIVIPHSAQQMAAFYEGREFPKAAINATRSACFFTIGIHNKSKNILWLNTLDWTLSTSSGAIPLLRRSHWLQRWKELNLAQRFQSTFRWTLLPEQLDFHANEREGGNITITRINTPFTLTARFTTGADKTGKPLTIVFNDLRCAEDNTP